MSWSGSKIATAAIAGSTGRFCSTMTMDGRHPGQPCPDSQDIVGKTDYDLSPAFLADQFRIDDEYVLAGKRIVNRIEMVGQPDGLTVWNVTNKIPLVDDDGAVIGTAGITRRLARPGRKSPRGPSSARSWPTCGIITTRRSPIASWPGWRICRSGPLSGNSAAAFTSRPRNICATSRCAWPAGLGLHRSVAGRGGTRLRLFRSKSLHPRIPSPFRPHPSRLS